MQESVQGSFFQQQLQLAMKPKLAKAPPSPGTSVICSSKDIWAALQTMTLISLCIFLFVWCVQGRSITPFRAGCTTAREMNTKFNLMCSLSLSRSCYPVQAVCQIFASCKTYHFQFKIHNIIKTNVGKNVHLWNPTDQQCFTLWPKRYNLNLFVTGYFA